MDRDTAYHKCGISSLEATTHHDENGKVDRAEFDHYFWINAGDAEHVIRGFYKSPTESKLFVFEEPTRKRGRERDEGDDVEAMEVLHSTGVIRISFARVERFDTRQTGLKCSPQQATIDGRINQKIKLTAKPGKVVKDGVYSSKCAVLSKEVIFERRIVYNTFGGFSGRNTFSKYVNQIDFYKGMPLPTFLQKPIRMQAILAFFRWVVRSRFDSAEQTRLQDLATEGVGAPQGSPNEWVRVEDIVHSTCRNLSPAASYTVCAGREQPGNYGEKDVQRLGYTRAQGLQDYFDKETGLVSFFMAEPGIFDIEIDGIDESKRPKENYKVKFSVVELDD